MCALPDYYEWFHSKDNPPLTWERLKQMEGRPVWVEEKYSFSDEWYGRWEVIDSVWNNELNGELYLYMTDEECRYKNTYGTLWKAYRKKRK